MTKQRVIDNLRFMKSKLGQTHEDIVKLKTFDAAITALEENQQYLEIGTIENCKKAMIIKENELYQEIELYVNGEKIGEAEIEIKGKMLSRLSIFPPYQNKGYGTEIVKMLNNKYGCDVLWVNADNERAIRIYEKNGFKIVEPTMYLMKR